jgi:NAD+ synthase (glutamine-hydrolysing)
MFLFMFVCVQRAYVIGKAVGAEVVTVDQSDEETTLHTKVETAVGIDGERFARGQLRSYMRTPVAYFAAQLMAQSGLPTIVLGTGNFDEDGYLCYFCKAGDGVVDVQLMADLHKSEVFMVGRELNVPSSILEAAPSADLWPGQTDEEELGMPYTFIEVFTEWMKMPEDEQEELLKDFSPEAKEQWDSMAEEARSIHRRNRHKLNFPVNL